METNEKKKYWLKILATLFLSFFAFIVFSNFKSIKDALFGADYGDIVIAIGAALASCLVGTYAFSEINQIFGLQNDNKRLFAIGFITIAFNNLITLGGSTGHTLRILLLKDKHQIKNILTASFFFSYLNILALAILSFISIGAVFFSVNIPQKILQTFEVIFFIYLFTVSLISLATFKHSFRKKILLKTAEIIKRVFKKDFISDFIHIDQILLSGLNTLGNFGLFSWKILGFILLDWIFSAITLFFCFRALGIFLTPAILFSGYFVGIATGLASMLPGGLGAQDLSQIAFYNIFGISIPMAMSVDILFRITYYFVPFLVALIMYWRLVWKIKK